MSVIDIDDPRVEHLIAMPTYFVGKKTIEDGPEATWDAACYHAEQVTNSKILNAMAEYLKALGFEAFVDAGEWPGAGDTLSVKNPHNPDDQVWYCEDVNGAREERHSYVAVNMHNQNTPHGPDNETYLFLSMGFMEGCTDSLYAIVQYLQHGLVMGNHA